MHEFLHFLHHHPLQEIKNNTSEYLCDGCKIPGVGTRYRCNICDFDLHECCATSSPTLASFLHPQHQLSQVVRAPENTSQNSRICDLCGDQVEGLSYSCKICDFDIHPVCTQLPEYIHHDVHTKHPLRFEAGSTGWCRICYEVCTSWRYKCGMCGVNFHLDCILAPPKPQSKPPPPPSNVANDNDDALYNSLLQYANSCQDGSIRPVCTEMPGFIYHDVHTKHPLWLEAGSTGWCRICYEVCTSRRYRCNACGFNFHPECILAPPPPQRKPPPPFNDGNGDAGKAVYNSPHQYANSYQNGSSSSKAVASNGKRNVGKKVGLFIGKVAIQMFSEALGIPDVSSIFF